MQARNVMTRFTVRVQPRATLDAIVGWTPDTRGGEILKIRLRAPAVEGKANAALLDFLAESLGVRPRQMAIEGGGKWREKIIVVEGLTFEEVKRQTSAET